MEDGVERGRGDLCVEVISQGLAEDKMCTGHLPGLGAANPNHSIPEHLPPEFLPAAEMKSNKC